jgi:hypothetical protein
MKLLAIVCMTCAVVGANAVHAQDAAPSRRAIVNLDEKEWQAFQAASKGLQGFSVVLLLGDAQGNSVPDGLSAPARKALADIKDFLPFKSYRVLDTQWVAAETGPFAQAQLRLHGVDSQEYEFILKGSAHPAPDAVEGQVELATGQRFDDAYRSAAYARINMLEDRVRSAKSSADDRAEIARLKQSLVGRQSLINTSLKVAIGETVVVGTSRVQGDKALVVLLTAVPK